MLAVGVELHLLLGSSSLLCHLACRGIKEPLTHRVCRRFNLFRAPTRAYSLDIALDLSGRGSVGILLLLRRVELMESGVGLLLGEWVLVHLLGWVKVLKHGLLRLRVHG